MTDLPPYSRAPITLADGTPVCGWGPEPQPVADKPRCLCSHAKTNHTRGEGQCWSAACGCSTYRQKETTA